MLMSIPKEFLRTDRIRAVCSVRNLKSEKVWLYTTEDAVKSYSSVRFSLDLGMHPSVALQSEYTELGLELFVIEIVREAGDGENLSDLLEETKREYIGKGIELYT